MKEKKRKYDWTLEDFKSAGAPNGLPKRWKPAEDWTEARARARQALDGLMKRGKLPLVWQSFAKTPEIALFEDLLGELERKYSSPVYMTSTATKQIGNKDETFKNMRRLAQALYKEAWENKAEEETKEPAMETLEESVVDKTIDKLISKKTALAGKGIKQLSKPIREKYSSDTTPISKFIKGDKSKLLHYFKTKDVETLGDYMKAMSNPQLRTAINVTGGSQKYRAEFEEFKKELFTYLNAMDGIVVTEGSKLKDLSYDDIQGGIYDEIKAMPASSFIKDSEDSKLIFSLWEENVKKRADEAVNNGASRESVSKAVEREIQKYKLIVDVKREQAQKEAFKASLFAKIDETANYKVNPKIYRKTKLEGHKHFPTKDGELEL